jgi:hypothetical protein
MIKYGSILVEVSANEGLAHQNRLSEHEEDEDKPSKLGVPYKKLSFNSSWGQNFVTAV